MGWNSVEIPTEIRRPFDVVAPQGEDVVGHLHGGIMFAGTGRITARCPRANKPGAGVVLGWVGKFWHGHFAFYGIHDVPNTIFGSGRGSIGFQFFVLTFSRVGAGDADCSSQDAGAVEG